MKYRCQQCDDGVCVLDLEPEPDVRPSRCPFWIGDRSVAEWVAYDNDCLGEE